MDDTEYFKNQENFETQGNDDFEFADFNFDVAGQSEKKTGEKIVYFVFWNKFSSS